MDQPLFKHAPGMEPQTPSIVAFTQLFYIKGFYQRRALVTNGPLRMETLLLVSFVEQAERDGRDAEFPAPHTKGGFAQDDQALLPLELRHPGEVTVRPKTKESPATYGRVSPLSGALRNRGMRADGQELTDDFARQAVVASVLAQDVIELLWPLQRLDCRYLVPGHGGFFLVGDSIEAQGPYLSSSWLLPHGRNRSELLVSSCNTGGRCWVFTMNGVIEALHIYDDNRSPILSHTYAGRPLSATHLLPLYLEHPSPRPNLIYLANTSPPTLVFSLTHANLLFLVTSSTEIEPLLVFEFLHRVIDAFEDFLGAPLLAVKIETSYDIVAQLLTEMCDAGTISTTEPNALREVVEQEGWVGKFLGSINLPGKTPMSNNYSNSSAPSLIASNTPALPWRRANVRHTSNEMYADVVETLTVTLAPSGRPLAAFANGTIAFTSKVSGVPDITLTLTSPSGKHNLGGIMELPVFHPCVRLNRWKERPGELSFIPPDGRFILAGYEVDLLPFTSGKSGSLSSNNLKLPVNMEVKTGLGATGSDFEVRLQVNKVLGAPSPSSSGQFGRGGSSGRLGGPHSGSPGAPAMDELTVTIPLPADVRNLPEIRPSKGDASFNPGEKLLEWHIPAKELSGGTSYFGLRCTVVGPLAGEDEDGFDANGFGFGTDYTINEPYQSVPVAKTTQKTESTSDDKDAKKVAQNKILMPTSASVSFSVKGWLASGLKVESIMLDTRKSRGLGESVKPYKGVKYLTVSKGGVEIRC
ncbi:hypothetical protein FZEAL_10025 [Fusarium zealandicum]|uniref:MHD domain-containing protein n=1 Tax=Fusarium zealandicum TaxID=1053134 RepID=A0A8H4U6L1_9HYPO|nr:hypothetical protein FZEAL_10025 [Fusarium zealandicum]